MWFPYDRWHWEEIRKFHYILVSLLYMESQIKCHQSKWVKRKRDRNEVMTDIRPTHKIVALPHYRRVNKFRCQQPMIIIKCISIFKIIQIVCVNKSCEIRSFFFFHLCLVYCKRKKNIVLCQFTSIHCNFMSFLAKTRARAEPISEKVSFIHFPLSSMFVNGFWIHLWPETQHKNAPNKW